MPPTPPVKYQKLPGRGSLAFQQVRLHLAPDHLLQVTSNGFTESYQRFYLQDIQTIAYHHTHAGKILNAVWGGLALFFLLLAAAVNEDPAWVGFGIVVGLFLGFLLVNFMLGPTCSCFITTAVQTRKLPSLGRARRARSVIDRLRPLITAAQGEFPGAIGRSDSNLGVPAAPASAPTGSPASMTGTAPAPLEAPPVIDPPA